MLDGRVQFLVETRDFSLLHSIQTSSMAYPASNPMGTGGTKLTTHLHLVPKLRNMELYLHSPIGLHGVVLN
jgi:hypothetical protein